MKESTAPVTVAVYRNPLDADIVKARLEAEGIPVHLFGRQQSMYFRHIIHAQSGVQVQVPPSVASRALEIIKKIEDGSYEQAIDEKFSLEPRRCERCNSENLEMQRESFTVLRFFMFLLGLYSPAPSQYHCKTCSHKWQP